LIAQIRKGGNLVAEILVVNKRAETKIIDKDSGVSGFLSIVLDNFYFASDPENPLAVSYSKVGDLSELISFVILRRFERDPEYNLTFLNAPTIPDPPEEKEGILY